MRSLSSSPRSGARSKVVLLSRTLLIEFHGIESNLQFNNHIINHHHITHPTAQHEGNRNIWKFQCKNKNENMSQPRPSAGHPIRSKPINLTCFACSAMLLCYAVSSFDIMMTTAEPTATCNVLCKCADSHYYAADSSRQQRSTT